MKNMGLILFFLVERNRSDKNYFHFDGDPIYNTDDDVSKDKIADFWSLGKPHRLEIFSEMFSMHI